MKKIVIASVIAAMFGASSAAMAANPAPTTVNFHGMITLGTCELEPVVNNGATSSIDLGAVEVGGTATEVEFALKPKSTAGCAGALANATVANVQWAGNFDTHGLANANAGTDAATGAYALITPVNAKAATPVTQSATLVAFDITDKSAGKPGNPNTGLKFKAQLKDAGVAGTYASTASYTVAYQ